VRSRGISVVAAAGNESSTEPGYPAGYPDVFSVSATDAQRNLTAYSNRGGSIDLAAPGGDSGKDITGDGYPDGVLSTDAAEGDFAYTFTSGTSMAAPHVAAVLALMKSVNPDLSGEDIASLLAAGALTDDAGAPGRDDDFRDGTTTSASASSMRARRWTQRSTRWARRSRQRRPSVCPATCSTSAIARSRCSW